MVSVNGLIVINRSFAPADSSAFHHCVLLCHCEYILDVHSVPPEHSWSRMYFQIASSVNILVGSVYLSGLLST